MTATCKSQLTVEKRGGKSIHTTFGIIVHGSDESGLAGTEEKDVTRTAKRQSRRESVAMNDIRGGCITQTGTKHLGLY